MAHTILVSGTRFLLTPSQITSDSPDNFLATSLLLTTSPTQPTPTPDPANQITLYSRPDVFAIIHDHLRGYPIFPLDRVACCGLGEERMMRYLKRDADFLGLQELVDLTDAAMKEFEGKAKEGNVGSSDPDRAMEIRVAQYWKRIDMLKEDIERMSKQGYTYVNAMSEAKRKINNNVKAIREIVDPNRTPTAFTHNDL